MYQYEDQVKLGGNTLQGYDTNVDLTDSKRGAVLMNTPSDKNVRILKGRPSLLKTLFFFDCGLLPCDAM
jgi:hypothetical protein